MCYESKADAQLALRWVLFFLPTGFLSHNALNHSIYFLWQGWFVWMKFLVKFKARVRGLRAS
jgi:hypothetical protein